MFFLDNELPNLYSTKYHYTDHTGPKNVLDYAHEAAVEAGKLEAETLHDLLGKLPTRKDLLYKVKGKKNEKRSELRRIWNNILRFSKRFVNTLYIKLPRKLQWVVRLIKRLETKVHNKLVCLEPMLQRRMGKMKFPNHGMGRYNGMPLKKDFGLKEKFYNLKEEKWEFLASVDDPNAQNETEIEYINDCFEDIPRMEYGWSVKVMLTEKEPCSFDPNASEDERCVITMNNQTDTFQRRQTGENFRSSAPADCRVEYVCEGDPLTDLIANRNAAPTAPDDEDYDDDYDEDYDEDYDYDDIKKQK